MSAVLQSAEAKTWRRFTPAQRLARFAVYLALVIVLSALTGTIFGALA